MTKHPVPKSAQPTMGRKQSNEYKGGWEDSAVFQLNFPGTILPTTPADASHPVQPHQSGLYFHLSASFKLLEPHPCPPLLF